MATTATGFWRRTCAPNAALTFFDLWKAFARLQSGRISARIEISFRRMINDPTNPDLQNAGTESEKGRMARDRGFDTGKYRDNPKAVAEYLNDALSTKDPFLITRAIGTMVRAQGVTRFSRKAGIRRDRLTRSFSAEESPAFDTVLKLLFGLDMALIVKAEARPQPVAKPGP
jgi:probable addiction module antidote protein